LLNGAARPLEAEELYRKQVENMEKLISPDHSLGWAIEASMVQHCKKHIVGDAEHCQRMMLIQANGRIAGGEGNLRPRESPKRLSMPKPKSNAT